MQAEKQWDVKDTVSSARIATATKAAKAITSRAWRRAAETASAGRKRLDDFPTDGAFRADSGTSLHRFEVPPTIGPW